MAVEIDKSNNEHLRSAYFWNTASGLLMAFQSVIMLIVMTRVCDLAAAGIFAIAYANANLFLNVGKYGMRNYQVSDASFEYSFRTYLYSRITTTCAMVFLSALFLFVSSMFLSYSTEKIVVIFVMVLFKAVDSFEDVFHGNYQQVGRLDIAGICLFFRLLFTLIVFSALLVLTRDLCVALVMSTLFTLLFFLCSIVFCRRLYRLPSEYSAKKQHGTLRLLVQCFPVFLAAFLLFLLCNVSKYAIDYFMNDSGQAIFNFISMPVFIVGLLASFIYNPIISDMSKAWLEGRYKTFVRMFIKQTFIIVAITVLCDIAALFLGAPVLGFLYATDLSAYVFELVILISGGGVLAIASLLTLGITIQRRQKKLILGYCIVSLIGIVLAYWFVYLFGLLGASLSFLLTMVILAVWFTVLFCREVLEASGEYFSEIRRFN